MSNKEELKYTENCVEEPGLIYVWYSWNTSIDYSEYTVKIGCVEIRQESGCVVVGTAAAAGEIKGTAGRGLLGLSISNIWRVDSFHARHNNWVIVSDISEMHIVYSLWMKKSGVRNSISYMINDKIALSEKSSSSKAYRRDQSFPA